jgi:hypothetical protein
LVFILFALEEHSTMKATLFFLLLSTTLGQPQAHEELVALIRQGNQNSRAAIRSIHARYEITYTLAISYPSGKTREPIITKVEWWQDGDKARWTQEITKPLTEDDMPARIQGAVRAKAALVLKTDWAIVDGERRIINHQYRPDGSHVEGADIRAYSRDETLPSDLWRNALFVVLTRPRSGLYDLLANPSCVRKLEQVTEGGETKYHLVVQAPKPMEDYELELTVQPSKNYLVSSWKANTLSPKETARLNDKVLAFREIAPSIFFPVEVEGRVYKIKRDGPDVLSQISRTKYSLLEINQASTNYPFHLPIPAGMPVVDHRNGTTYIATEDGKPTVVGPAPTVVAAAQVPTYEETQEWPRFVPIAAACVVAALLLAGGIYYLRRKRGQAIQG